MTVLAAIAVVALGRSCVGHQLLVRGHSMKPTVLDGELVWLSVRQRPLTLGDVVAVDQQGEGLVLKRVVGLARDSVEVRAGELIRNGSTVVVQPLGRSENWKDANQVLPLGKLFAERFVEDLGPLHFIQRFSDSTSMPVTTVPEGFVFILGAEDNRGDSVDSRTFGPVPLSSLRGRVDVEPVSRSGD